MCVNSGATRSVNIDGDRLEDIEEFTYLGSVISMNSIVQNGRTSSTGSTKPSVHLVDSNISGSLNNIAIRPTVRHVAFRNCRAGAHSRPQRPHSFWSAPRIATSGQVQHLKPAIQRLPVTLRMFRVYCVYKSIQNQNVVGPGQRSRFLVLTKRSAASWDENERELRPNDAQRWCTENAE